MAENEGTRESQGGGQPPPAPASPPAVDHFLAALEAQFGERLDEAGRARVREGLERMVAGGAALSAAPLANGDEPDFVFRAYRGGER